VTATITVGSQPDSVAVNTLTNKVYVANSNSGTLSVISGSTNKVTDTIKVGVKPDGVAVNPSTNTVYVTDAATYDASVISGSTNSLVSMIRVGSNQTGVAVEPESNTIYITDSANQVAIVSGITDTVEKAVNVGYQPYAIALDQSTHSAFVTNYGENDVSVLAGPASSTAVSCSSTSAAVGSALTCTATVSGISPVGTVTWSASGQGAFSPTFCTLSSGTCAVTYAPSAPGAVNVTCYYSSDANNAISFASLPVIVAGSSENGFPTLLAASVATGALGVAVLFVGLRSRRKPA
jgi:YVTN family beta-propeller protein